MQEQTAHWADAAATNVLEARGEKEVYTCASGITPSGTVHIGNFREIISVDLVVRALREMGKRVRFIYSWDDYDVFRKVPENMPNKEMLHNYLRMPITLVPDPAGVEKSYARANERALERILPSVGVEPEYIYQAERYQASRYAQGIRTALEKREVIRVILDEHRSEPLPDDWMPVSVFCMHCMKDTTKVMGWDGEWSITYHCNSCGNEESIDLRKTGAAKLPWRIDWPMRWAYEGVDFEPAGKDHQNAGGSFDTARGIVREVYGGEPPVTFKYDFVSIKGMGGKISSSTGKVIGLDEVLEVYQPEIVRYLFAGTRPSAEFAISFDLDVLKIYEDYDRTERIAFGLEEVDDKRRAKERRIYELSQVGPAPDRMPVQVSFRHLCSLLQIHMGNLEEILQGLGPLDPEQARRLTERARCATAWLEKYAPADFRFSLRRADAAPIEVSSGERSALQHLRERVERLESFTEKTLADELYRIAEEAKIDAKDLFRISYRALIDSEKGPRLASFLITVGKERALALLSRY